MLSSPGEGLLGPDAVRIFLLEHAGQPAEDRVIVRRFVVTDAFPYRSFAAASAPSASVLHCTFIWRFPPYR